MYIFFPKELAYMGVGASQLDENAQGRQSGRKTFYVSLLNNKNYSFDN